MMIYDEANERHARSVLASTYVFWTVLSDNFPNTALKIRNVYSATDLIFDFLLTEGKSPGAHPTFLYRNCFVNAKRSYPDINEEDHRVIINLFLVLYLTNLEVTADLMNWVADLAEDAKADVIRQSPTTLASTMSDVMLGVIKVGFGDDYTPYDMGLKIIDYKTVLDKVCSR